MAVAGREALYDRSPLGVNGARRGARGEAIRGD